MGVRVMGSRTRMGRCDEGASALEFAIILPVLLLILLGIIEFGLMYQAQLAVTHAAREGARFASVHQDSAWDPSYVEARAYPLTVAGGLAISKSGTSESVTVIVNYPYDLKFLDIVGPLQLHSSATMRRE